MPELPEVETVVRTLAPHVVGRRIVGVPHLRSDMLRPTPIDFPKALAGQNIADLRRRAKRIVFTLASGDRFFIHLGMTGRLTIEDSATATVPHTHLIADLDTGRQLRLSDPRRFGEIVWLGKSDHDQVGPEPLTLRPSNLMARLGKTRRAIKTALLDQKMIAGIGNIYADEALHRAEIHPERTGASLTHEEIRRLNRAIKAVLNNAIRAGGSSIRDYVNADGAKGGFQNSHKVYDREGKPCRKCRGAIVRITLGGRSTHYCPNCQN
jgi:formamidopyrimidine-DNA glycosylase